MGRDLLFFQLPAQFFQCPFFNTGDVAAAQSCDLSHFPLTFGRLVSQSVPQLHHLLLTGCQTSGNRLPQLLYLFFD